MKSIGDLLKELGFNSAASLGSQNAFLNHLLQNAIATSAQNISSNHEQPAQPQQLSFDEKILGQQLKNPLLPRTRRSR